MPAAVLVDGADVVDVPGRGCGLVANRAMPAGTCLFTEFPLVAMQHGENARSGVIVCEHCFRFLGPLDAQINALLCGRRATARAPEQLPIVPGTDQLPVAVCCPGGCNLRFCSQACANQNFASHHRLLCPGGASHCGGAGPLSATPSLPAAPPGAPPVPPVEPLEESVSAMRELAVDDMQSSSAASESAAALAADGAAAEAAKTAASMDDLPTEPLARFAAHARATNEIFSLAAKAAAHVLCRLEESGLPGYEAAMANFDGPLWWEAVATPDDVTDEVAFRRTLRELLIESWTLLCAVLGPRAPAECALLATPAPYAMIVGAFERRNCAVQVASPVEAYFLAVDAMPEGEAKANATAVTAPLLDALDVAYSSPCEGTGIFPLQAMLNHSCEPNVTLLKEEGPEEHDGRVVARLMRDVAAGEELCNAYVDISLPVRRRRRELREYGFECDCPRCERELAAANEKKAAKVSRADGKRRLK